MSVGGVGVDRQVVAECWTCAYGEHGSDYLGGEPGKPRQLRDPINVENHRQAGHDVRPVARSLQPEEK